MKRVFVQDTQHALAFFATLSARRSCLEHLGLSIDPFDMVFAHCCNSVGKMSQHRFGEVFRPNTRGFRWTLE